MIIPYGKIHRVSDLGAIVRAKRRSLRLTQARAAALCGVGTRFLSEIERGKPTCAIGLTLQVLRRFGIEVEIAPRGGGA